MRFLKPIIIAAILVGNASAAPAVRGGRQVRFMAVGEPPPFRQIVRDGVRYEQEPAVGSIPPRSVMLGFGDETTESVPRNLDRISPPLPVPAGSGPLILTRAESADDATTWLKLNRPETGDFLVLLWRDAKEGSWEKARSMILPDSAVARPAGSVSLVNLSPVDVRIVISDEKLLLQAGKSFGRKVPYGAELPFQVLLPDRNANWKPLHSGVITQNTGERSLVLVYRADGESPRRPLKVNVQRERAPIVEKPE